MAQKYTLPTQAQDYANHLWSDFLASTLQYLEIYCVTLSAYDLYHNAWSLISSPWLSFYSLCADKWKYSGSRKKLEI